MNSEQDRRREPATFTRAVTISVVVHLLLLLILALLPEREDPPAPEPELAVRFDLTPPPDLEPPAESDLFRPSNPVEERPTEEPVNPAPSSLGRLLPDPAPPSPRVEPTPPSPEVEPVEEPRDESEPPRDEPTEEADEAERAQADERGLDLPGEGADFRRGRGEPADERLDLGRAIRNYRPSPRPAAPTEPPVQPGTQEGMELPDLDRLPVSGFGMDRNLMFESADYDWSDYARQIYMAIWRAWHSRLWQTTAAFERWAFENQRWDLQHQVLIQFTIQSNGEITDIFVVTESGCVPLDASATDAMSEVVLPALPDDFPRSRERVRGRFIASGDIRAMKRNLDWLKQAGWF